MALSQAANDPSKGIWYLDEAGKSSFQSYRDLQFQASLIAGHLHSMELGRGSRILIQLADARELLPAVWGCLSAGAVACIAPAAAPFAAKSRMAPAIDWASIANCCFQIKDFSSSESPRSISFRELPGNETWATDRLPDDFALILFTSGSTGLPKAVPLRDRNLIGYMFGMAETHHFGPDDVVLNWLGLDHIGAICMMHLLAIGACCSQVQVATRYILDDMPRWLDVMDEYGVTIGWSPNFAYRVLVEQRESVLSKKRNLSRVRYLINGGEQVQTATIRLFEEMLSDQGLVPGAVRPCYGMSETCSAITASDDQSWARRGRYGDVAEVGPPIAGARIRVTGDDGQIVEEGVEGRIELAGPSVFEGYLVNEEHDYLKNGWLLTEDMGFLRDGRLYITGRRKETVIINSRHYPCVEIEDAAAIDEVDRQSIVACGFRTPGADTEQLALFFAPKRRDLDLQVLSQEIRIAVQRRIGRAPDVLIPFSQDQVPRSGIGKVLRQRLKAELQSGKWDHAIISSAENGENELFEQSWRISSWGLGASIHTQLGAWILFEDGDELSSELAAQIKDRGGAVRIIRSEDLTADDETSDRPRGSGNSDSWRRTIAQISNESEQSLRGLILHLSSDSRLAPPEDARRIFLACRSAARALAEVNVPSPLSLRVVFRVPVGAPLSSHMVQEVSRSAVKSIRSDGILEDATWSIIDESPSTVRRFVNELNSLKTMATQWRRGRRYELEISRIQADSMQPIIDRLGSAEIEVTPTAASIGQGLLSDYSRRRLNSDETQELICGTIVGVGKDVVGHRSGECVIAQASSESLRDSRSLRLSSEQILRSTVGGCAASSIVQFMEDAYRTADFFTTAKSPPETKLMTDTSFREATSARNELNPKFEAFARYSRDSHQHRMPHHVVAMDQFDDARRFVSTGKNVGPVIVERYFRQRVRRERMDRQDGIFLVVGGLGGLGRILCRQLSASRVKGLIIIGRRSPTLDDNRFLNELRLQTELVRYEIVDVANRDSIEAFCEQVRQSSIPIQGVFHLAADLGQEMVDDDPFAIADEMRSKMDGAWHLHECFRKLPLKEFVLFSSVESLIPAKGRAAYSAANAFLDGLVRWRRQQELPGLSICWGAFPETGLIQRMQLPESTQTNSWMLRSYDARLTSTIDRIIELGGDVAVACSTEHQANISLPTYVLLNHLATDGASASREDSSSVIDLADLRNSDSRREGILALLDHTLAKVTGWRRSLQLTTTFEEMGVDSIQVVGVLYSLGKAMGLVLSATLLTDCKTAGDIVNALEKKLLESIAKRSASYSQDN